MLKRRKNNDSFSLGSLSLQKMKAILDFLTFIIIVHKYSQNTKCWDRKD